MKYLKRYPVAGEGPKLFENVQISSNVLQIDVKSINKDIIDLYKKKYPNKWILYYSNDDTNYIFIKDLPKNYMDDLPDKVYHVSPISNLDVIGIKPSTEENTPFGYYNISFFYLSEEDAHIGSIPHLEDETFLYEIKTNIPNVNWLEGFNEPLDGEENITTSDFIDPKFIKKIINI